MPSLVNKEPLVSIVITSYNCGKFIDAAIQSARDQDYPNMEIVISDNSSTDETDSIVKKHIHDKRIKYFVNESNIGMVPNFKLATEERATGTYITYISSDDYLCNTGFISKAVELINKYPNIVLVAARNATLYGEINEVVENESGQMYEQEFMNGIEMFTLYPKWPCPSFAGVVMNREKLMETNGFASRAISLDYEVNLKLMVQGNLAFIKETSYIWRKHTSQASGNMNMESQINNLDFIENTIKYAKKIDIKIDLESWRQRAYISYVNGVARRMINNKYDIDRLLYHIKTVKRINFSFYRFPKTFILLKIYKHYDKLKFLLKWLYPKMYQAIEKDK